MCFVYYMINNSLKVCEMIDSLYQYQCWYLAPNTTTYEVVPRSYENVFIKKDTFKWPSFASSPFKVFPFGVNTLSPTLCHCWKHVELSLCVCVWVSDTIKTCCESSLISRILNLFPVSFNFIFGNKKRFQWAWSREGLGLQPVYSWQGTVGQTGWCNGCIVMVI